MSSSEEIWICSVRIRWLGEAYFLLFNWYWNRAIENRYWTFKLELLDLKLISTHMSPSVFYFDLGNGGSAKNQKPVDNQNKCFRLNVRSVKITREQWAEAAYRWCSIGRNNLLEIGLRYQFRLSKSRMSPEDDVLDWPRKSPRGMPNREWVNRHGRRRAINPSSSLVEERIRIKVIKDDHFL